MMFERGGTSLIHQFFPNKMAFDSIKAEDVDIDMIRLSYHPRKCLGFKTPHEVFMNQLRKLCISDRYGGVI